MPEGETKASSLFEEAGDEVWQDAEQTASINQQFIHTGAKWVGGALELEMMVGSWYVPDETDLYLFGLGKAARVAGKLKDIDLSLIMILLANSEWMNINAISSD